MKLSRNLFKRAITALAAAALLVAPAPALAETVLPYEPSLNPVADNITRVDFEKLETGSRDPVKGAKLQIIEEATGVVVEEWVSQGTKHRLEKKLNVDTVYILREVEAPAGYQKAPDTRFILHSVDFNTVGEILNLEDEVNGEKVKDHVEFESISGSGDEQGFAINLFDDAYLEQEKVVHEKDEISRKSSSSTSSKLPQTSDLYDPTLTYICAGVGAASLVLAIGLRHEKKQ